MRANVHDLLAFVGLERRAQELAANLAYGEQRLLGIAIALAAGPRAAADGRAGRRASTRPRPAP